MRALALAILLAFGVAGVSSARAAGSAAPGVGATTIKLGSVIDQTGRGTVISIPILGGYKLAIAEVNAHGGINGRKIAFTALSDNYDASQTLQQVKQLVESEGVFAMMGVFGSDEAQIAAPYLEADRVPFFDPIGGGIDIKGKRWIWQTEPDYVREGKVIANYVAGKLHAKRVAILYQVGVGEGQRDALKSTLRKDGAALVADASYQPTDSNLSGQVIRLRSANPDLVVLNGTPTPTAAFITYAKLLGFKPKDGFLANYPMGDPFWLSLIKSLGEGNYVSSYADLTGKNAVAAQYRRAISRYHGDPYSNYGLYGYFNASLFFKALKLAGRSLTRQRLQTVLNTRFRNYTTGFTGKINWTPAQHFGARQFKIYKIHGDKFLPITGWVGP